MPGFLLHVGASLNCPHGGMVNGVPSSPKVLLGGQIALTAADQWLVAGCAFTVPPGKPQPCVKVVWMAPATKVLLGGKPAVLSLSSGLCQSPEQAPQGPPLTASSQTKVMGV
ncbi:MAG: hypothetical protein ACO1SX_11045 [Actinomycetota bacterium]